MGDSHSRPDGTFPDRLRIVRELWDAGQSGPTTDQAFAAALGLTPQNFSGVKNSLKPPPAERVLDMATKVSAAIGVRVDPGWLLYGPASNAPAPAGAQDSQPLPPVLKRKRSAPLADPGPESAKAPGRKRA